MTTLLLTFHVFLEDNSLGENLMTSGPIFHRWLPNGQEDAIQLPITDPGAELKVWFERRGYVEDGWIKFDCNRKEVDSKIMRNQAKLVAGPLFGMLKIQNISTAEEEALRQNSMGDSQYMALGKRVLRLIENPVAGILDMLRIIYGQYWLAEFLKWDRQNQIDSLGNYCFRLGMKWSLDDGKTSSDFLPDKPIAIEGMTIQMGRDYSDYLSSNDWESIQGELRHQRGYKPSLAEQVFARANRLLKEDDMKYAYVESVTAFEIAVGDFIKDLLGDSKALKKAIGNIGIGAKGAFLSVVSGKNNLADVELAFSAIETRNKIVHEGYEPIDNDKTELEALLKVISTLLPAPVYKRPSARGSNWRKHVDT